MMFKGYVQNLTVDPCKGRENEAEFLDEIQKKVVSVFLLAIHSRLYSFALRFLFLHTHATSYSFTIQLLYTVKEKKENLTENLTENHTPIPMV
jgi:hypothetical protein